MNNLFRQSALDRLNSPEQLDQLIKIISPRKWLALFGLIIIIFALTLWSFLGNIPVQVSASGVLIRGAGIATIQSTTSGQISKVFIASGDTVNQGDPVAQVIVNDEIQEFTSPFAGNVLEVRIGPGEVAMMGEDIVSIETLDPLRAVLYLPFPEAVELETGMEVQLAVSGMEEYGYITGKIEKIGQYPVTYDGMLRTLGNPELVESLMISKGVEIYVTLNITEDDFEWTLPPETPVVLHSGMMVEGLILVEKIHPVDLLFFGLERP